MGIWVTDTCPRDGLFILIRDFDLFPIIPLLYCMR